MFTHYPVPKTALQFEDLARWENGTSPLAGASGFVSSAAFCAFCSPADRCLLRRGDGADSFEFRSAS